MFDLTVYPLSFNAGRELYEMPGLLVLAAPRKAARMRGQDQLIVSMKLLTISAGNGGQISANFTPAQQAEMLNRLAETYFSFSGSVTAGLRAVTARLNEFLLSRNLKAAHEGQTVGILNLAVIHGSALIVAHAGPTHTFVLGKDQVQHFDDSLPAGGAGRGLGLSKLAVPRFYQVTLDANDLLLFCAEPPPSWTARSLANSPQLPFDHLRRRLLSESTGDLQAALLRLQPGKGQVTFYRPGDRVQEPPAPRAERSTRGTAPSHRPAPADTTGTPGVTAPAPAGSAAPAAPPAQVEPAVSSTPVSEPPAARAEETTPVPPFVETLDKSLPSLEDQPPAAAPLAEPASEPPAPHPAVFLGGAAGEAAAPAQPVPPQPRPRTTRQLSETQAAPAEARPPSRPPIRSMARSLEQGEQAAARPAGQLRTQRQPAGPKAPRENAFAKSITAAAQNMRAAWLRGAPRRAKASEAVSTAARKAMPKRYDTEGREVPLFSFNMSSSVMLAVAIIVPLVVVAVATAVYFQAGRSEQFQAIFLQAQQYAIAASQQADPVQQRESWTRTYELVRKAEQYGRDDQSEALRKQAQEALDNLEGLVRLNYLPAARSGFPAGVSITRIAATLNDVYLLDSSEGRILRLYRTATGYDVDTTFTCGAGQVGSLVVDKLIDMAPMSASNEPGASVVGIDGNGNLVYCSPNMEGFKSTPLALPDAGWGKIRGIYLYGEKLYVLDPSGNAVYYYDGDKGVFAGKPHFYFGDQIPRMADVVDMTVDQEFLYLLHADGQMTVCEGGGYSLAPTNCQDTPYGDARAGFDPAPLTFPGATISQVQATQPPDPSLFALDSANRSIYHLSLRRLNLQRQYVPLLDTDFPVPNGPATAFAIAPNRRALIAFGNQVFYAPLP